MIKQEEKQMRSLFLGIGEADFSFGKIIWG